MLGLMVRFTCRDEASAAAYDRLVSATAQGIREPGTLVYAVHTVQGKPLERVFYERSRRAVQHPDQPTVADLLLVVRCRARRRRDRRLSLTRRDHGN
jgi:hypothetical protein